MGGDRVDRADRRLRGEGRTILLDRVFGAERNQVGYRRRDSHECVGVAGWQPFSVARWFALTKAGFVALRATSEAEKRRVMEER